MKPVDFVTAIRKVVIEEGCNFYKDELEANNPKAIEPTWKGILPIYQILTLEQKASFLQFVRLVQVNTISEVFGILDGSSYLSDERVTFTLKAGEEVISGDLQDIFWAEEQDE